MAYSTIKPPTRAGSQLAVGRQLTVARPEALGRALVDHAEASAARGMRDSAERASVMA